MQERVKSKAEKKRVTLEIDPALAAAAAERGLDLASELERALGQRLGPGQTGLSDEDRAAMNWAEEFVAKHGRWTDGLDKL